MFPLADALLVFDAFGDEAFDDELDDEDDEWDEWERAEWC